MATVNNTASTTLLALPWAERALTTVAMTATSGTKAFIGHSIMYQRARKALLSIFSI
jgi:hypothetical protein